MDDGPDRVVRLVVEIAGPAGVGKSVVAPLVTTELRRRLGDDAVVRLSPDPADAAARRMALGSTMLRHPGVVWAGARMPPASKASRLAATRRWMSVIATMRVARRELGRGVRVCVVEQGPVHYLREVVELDRLPAFALPEVVMEVTADPATVLERRLTRDKPVRDTEKLHGERRATQAARLAARLSDVPEARARQLLVRWSQAFCSPPLGPDELDASFDRGRNHTPVEHPDDHWSRATIRGPLRERLHWTVVRNESNADLDDVARKATDAILRLLGGEA